MKKNLNLHRINALNSIFVVKNYVYMKNKTHTLSLLMILVGFVAMLSSCKEDVTLLKPVVETSEVSSIAADSALSGGVVTSDGGNDVIARGVCWSKAPNPTIKDSLTIDASGTGEYSSIMIGLQHKTKYYVRSYATNGGGTAYGLQVSFTTTDGIANVNTLPVTLIYARTATCNANVAYDGGAEVTERGFCWSTMVDPTVSLTTKSVDSTGIGSFKHILIDLLPSTKYYVRAYATNNEGTVYGDNASFTTTDGIANVMTLPVTLIYERKATCNANVAYDGGAIVTERGFCWSTMVDPTVSLTTKSVDSTGVGSFQHILINLLPATKYYVRAYATNIEGTFYSENVSFTTLSLLNKVEDVEGNIYKTVTIGSQVWMSENLKTTKYNDGSSIPNLTDETQWISTTKGAYCDYGNNVSNSTVYGRLYNWYSVSDTRKLCPKGWSVPSDDEWQTLVNFLGGESYAGGKLKESGTSHWLTPNTGANNVYGFTALPAGHRDGAALYRRLGDFAIWWTATEESSLIYSWRRSVEYNTEYVSTNRNFKTLGFSVRCVKN